MTPKLVVVWERFSKPHEVQCAILDCNAFESNFPLFNNLFNPSVLPLTSEHRYLLNCWVEPFSLTSSKDLGSSFAVQFLFEDSIKRLKFCSDQQYALKILENEGPCQESHNACMSANLIQASDNLGVTQNNLFQFIFEKNFIPVLCNYVLKKKNTAKSVEVLGTSQYELANPKAVYDWAWNLFDQELKFEILAFCQSPNSLINSDIYFTKLMGVVSLFSALLLREDITEEGRSSLEKKFQTINLTTEYLEVVNWFVKHDLLPDKSLRHFRELELIYKRLRESFKSLNQDSNLFIDHFVNSQALKQFPPPNLSELLRIFCQGTLNDPSKHFIVFFFRSFNFLLSI